MRSMNDMRKRMEKDPVKVYRTVILEAGRAAIRKIVAKLDRVISGEDVPFANWEQRVATSLGLAQFFPCVVVEGDMIRSETHVSVREENLADFVRELRGGKPSPKITPEMLTTAVDILDHVRGLGIRVAV